MADGRRRTRTPGGTRAAARVLQTLQRQRHPKHCIGMRKHRARNATATAQTPPAGPTNNQYAMRGAW
eukprot:11210678-Lingulodinium_polyedra.AAC.1